MLSKILTIDYKETKVKYRKFIEYDQSFSNHIENIGFSFLFGYNNFLYCKDIDSFIEKIQTNIKEYNEGFSFEGSGMSAYLLDCIRFWKKPKLFNSLINHEYINQHEYMLYVGAGWAIARLPFKEYLLNRHNSYYLDFLVFDGYGFHEGYFNNDKSIRQQLRPKYILSKYYSAFDQGLGRSLWFVFGGNSYAIASTINKFSKSRRTDLWSGIGLASTYAGGNEKAIKELYSLSKEHYVNLAQGSAFAAKARIRAKSVPKHTDYATNVYCGISAIDAAELSDVALRKSEYNNYIDWQNQLKTLLKNCHDINRRNQLRLP